jgi:3-phenylpropionate/trans-cinnamate dioxygenase ferredoxin reductase subunit
LIATGSSPKALGIPGEDLAGVFTLKTVDDADKLVKAAAGMEDIVIIGGGLIGLQAANALYAAGRNIRIVIGSRQPLSRNVDPSCAENVCQGIRECGMSILFETHAVSIKKVKNKLSVELSSNNTLEADAVIIGKGVSPNVQLVAESEIEINQGIIVDETMRTNVPNVRGIKFNYRRKTGDCHLAQCLFTGPNRRNQHGGRHGSKRGPQQQHLRFFREYGRLGGNYEP